MEGQKFLASELGMGFHFRFLMGPSLYINFLIEASSFTAKRLMKINLSTLRFLVFLLLPRTAQIFLKESQHVSIKVWAYLKD